MLDEAFSNNTKEFMQCSNEFTDMLNRYLNIREFESITGDFDFTIVDEVFWRYMDMTEIRLRCLLEKQIKSNDNLNKRLGGANLDINQKVQVLYHYLTTRYKLEEILDIRFVKDGFNIGTTDGVSPKEFFKLATMHYIDSLFDEDCVNMTSSQIEQYSKDVFNILKRVVAEAVVESIYLFEE